MLIHKLIIEQNYAENDLMTIKITKIRVNRQPSPTYHGWMFISIHVRQNIEFIKWQTFGLPPRMISVPLPAMLVDMVIAYFLPAWATISASLAAYWRRNRTIKYKRNVT